MLSVSTALSAELETILLRELACCQSLLETVEAERQAIKALAIGDFHPINVRRLGILEQLQSIGDARDQAVGRIAAALSLTDSRSSLHALLDRWHGQEATAIRRHHGALMALAKHVREEIKQNVVLIDGIRGFVEQALTAGASALTDGNAYNRTGKPALAHSLSAVLYQQG
ncbi:MAG: flagellar export chaperone FlgN [Nitrospira sp.]|nr:flagellar export chaperone FlgN [Nitrospira sp.]